MRHASTREVSNFNTLLASAGLAATLLAAACGDGATDPAPPPELPRATTVAVTPRTAELTALGATVQLSAQVVDQNGQAMAGAAVTWSSGSATIATVSATGLVTAVQNGSVTITATSGSASGNAAVTVAQAASSVTMTPASDTLAPRDTLRLSAEATDANGNAVAEAEFSWTSSAAAVARVDNSGLVTAVAVGSATITAVAGDASGTSEITVNITERDVLESFYEATGGENWRSDDNWLTDAPLGEWYGVGTEAGGRVDSLDLPHNDLTGSIPPVIGRLENLKYLDLSDNGLSGSIPPELGNLKNLTYLALGFNNLTGTIPPELGNLASLEILRLVFNDLAGTIPAELGKLAKLRELELGAGQLEGTRTNVPQGKITGTIPPELGQLPNLTLLALFSTPLTGSIPAELGNLTNLEDLIVEETQLTGSLPVELGNLTNLWRLDLSDNALNGSIPVELGNLTNLAGLDLRKNALNGSIPVELGNLTNLRFLGVSENNLTGTVPRELGQLATLQNLQFQGNQLTDEFPAAFTSLDEVVEAHWGRNAGLCAPRTAAFDTWLAGMDSSSGPRCTSASVDHVEVVPADARFSALGDTLRLTSVALDANGHAVADAEFFWESGDGAVATVDAAGLVTAVANGTATITATSGSVSGSVAVTVAQEVSAVAATPDTASLAALGDTLRLAAEALDATGHAVAGAEFSWESGDGAVATVDAAGLVTGVANGTATITATSGSVSGSATVTVAQEIVSVAVLPAHLTSAQAGKPGAETIDVTVMDGRGSPVVGATYRWSTDRHSGWVYPLEGITDGQGRFRTTWVAGWPGEGTLSVTVENEFSRATEDLATLSTTPGNPPLGDPYIWISNQDNPSAGYSIDMTPLTEPTGTYYVAIQWDGGYTGLQRGGSRYDRQLQFSVWDAPEYGDATLVDRASDVLCRTFGGEGTGVACELNYPWTTGSTYRFEVTEEEMDGGSAITLHVTDLAAGHRRFVGTIRFARLARMTEFGTFVEDFVRRAPHCLAKEVRSVAIRRPRAWIGGAWVALDEMTRGHFDPPPDDHWNPGTPGCANVAAREHAAGLELVSGGETASDPNASRAYTVPRN